jgi:hypothetical protein
MIRYYIVMQEISTGNTRAVYRMMSEEQKDSFLRKCEMSTIYKLLRFQEAY